MDKDQLQNFFYLVERENDNLEKEVFFVFVVVVF